MPRGLAVVAVLSLLTSFPALSAAQDRAGVVTTLTGRASVARAVASQPQPLGFKDDVFPRDRIATAEQSLVRMLLGGKALVTVRELSTFTISEEAQRATIDLQGGKIGVAAARQLFRPGERLEIRTPNAVASIRGTLLVAERLPNGDARFSVVRSGAAEVCQSAGAAACVSIVAGERAVVSATSIRSEPIPPGEDPEAGLRPGGPQHTDPPAEITADVTARAAQAATALAPPAAPFPPPPSLPPPPSVTRAPVLPGNQPVKAPPQAPPPSRPRPDGGNRIGIEAGASSLVTGGANSNVSIR
jgi:hypothetical protein